MSLPACPNTQLVVFSPNAQLVIQMMTAIRGWSEDVAGAALATVAVLLLASFIGRKASHRPRRQLPPGPRGWPILGSLLMLGTQPHKSLYELSKQYGPVMLLYLGSVRTLVVSSSRFAEEIFKTHDKIMASRPVPIVVDKIFYKAADILFAPYGPYWRYVRKVCTVGLLTANRVSQFREIREREGMAMLHFILAESQRGSAVNMSQSFFTFTMNNITQMMMNQSYCVQSSGLKSAPQATTSRSLPSIRELFELVGAFNIADYVPVLKPFDLQGLGKRSEVLHRQFDRFLDEIIDEHRQRRSIGNPENYKEDFVDALLGFGQTKEFQEHLSMDSVKAILLDMITGAGETASVTSTWALTELVKNPHVLRKVQDELVSVVGLHRLVQEKDLPDLHYLNAVVKETFRLHPPAPLLMPHVASQDCEIDGFHVPGGSHVYVNAWAIQRDPAVWDKPLEFDPDRFLHSETDFRGQDSKFLPFGTGRRVCPGMNLGAMMATYPLTLLLHALDWTLPDGQKPEELDVSEAFAVVLHKRLPLEVVGKARLPHHVLYPAQASEAVNGPAI